jgi:hypothetical protein
MRNESANEELLSEARLVFRKDGVEIHADTDCCYGKDIHLPAGRWITIDIDSGLRGRFVLEGTAEAFFTAKIVGSTHHIDFRIAAFTEGDVR